MNRAAKSMAIRPTVALGFLLALFASCLCAQTRSDNASEVRSNGTQTGASAAPTGQFNAPEQPAKANQASDAFARYAGYRIRSVSFKNAQRIDQSDLIELLPTQAGAEIDRAVVHASIQQLFATGRFRTIAAEVSPYPDRSLDLVFV